jgi:hypothetical protein
MLLAWSWEGGVAALETSATLPLHLRFVAGEDHRGERDGVGERRRMGRGRWGGER